MRLNLLISSTGTILNEGQNNFIQSSPVNGSSGFSLFQNQITLEFFTGVTTLANNLIVPNYNTLIMSGLSGTVTVSAVSSINSPYSIPFGAGTLDISSACVLSYTGIVQALKVVCSGVTGANYINILLDRA